MRRFALIAVCLLLPVTGHAAITCTNKIANGSSSDAASYNTAEYTPTASVMAYAVVASAIAANPPTTPTATHAGDLTWTQVSTAFQQSAGGTDYYRITVFRAATDASPAAGLVTFDFGGNNQLGAQWSIDECTELDRGGTNGGNSIVQTVASVNDTTCLDSQTCTITLAAFSGASNATIGWFFNNVNNDVTVGTDFTELSDNGGTNMVRRLFVEYKAANDTSVDATRATAGIDWAAVASELKAAPAGSGSPPSSLLLLGAGAP